MNARSWEGKQIFGINSKKLLFSELIWYDSRWAGFIARRKERHEKKITKRLCPYVQKPHILPLEIQNDTSHERLNQRSYMCETNVHNFILCRFSKDFFSFSSFSSLPSCSVPRILHYSFLAVSLWKALTRAAYWNCWFMKKMEGFTSLLSFLKSVNVNHDSSLFDSGVSSSFN